MPGIQNSFFMKPSYFTGMEDTSLGTTLAFTLTFGKSGLSLILQGHLNWFVRIAEAIINIYGIWVIISSTHKVVPWRYINEGVWWLTSFIVQLYETAVILHSPHNWCWSTVSKWNLAKGALELWWSVHRNSTIITLLRLQLLRNQELLSNSKLYPVNIRLLRDHL